MIAFYLSEQNLMQITDDFQLVINYLFDYSFSTVKINYLCINLKLNKIHITLNIYLFLPNSSFKSHERDITQ